MCNCFWSLQICLFVVHYDNALSTHNLQTRGLCSITIAIFRESYLFLQLTEAWHQTKEKEDWKPCLNSLVPNKGKVTAFTNMKSRIFLLEWNSILIHGIVGLQESNGFIIIEANGGLNQQRSSVFCNPDLLDLELYVFKWSFTELWITFLNV